MEIKERTCLCCGRKFKPQEMADIQCPECLQDKATTKWVRKIKICVNCGKEFYVSQEHYKYCSDACKMEANAEQRNRDNENFLKRYLKSNTEIVNETVEARENGMSYGQWVAKKYMENEKKKRGR